jgi:hypothetical protein
MLSSTEYSLCSFDLYLKQENEKSKHILFHDDCFVNKNII